MYIKIQTFRLLSRSLKYVGLVHVLLVRLRYLRYWIFHAIIWVAYEDIGLLNYSWFLFHWLTRIWIHIGLSKWAKGATHSANWAHTVIARHICAYWWHWAIGSIGILHFRVKVHRSLNCRYHLRELYGNGAIWATTWNHGALGLSLPLLLQYLMNVELIPPSCFLVSLN